MTILKVFYASGGSDRAIPSIEILIDGLEPIRICQGYEDQYLGVDGVLKLFEAGSLSVSLPSDNTSGQQNLNFGVANVNGKAQQYVDYAIENDIQVRMIYREYLESDKSAPARRPYEMIIRGGRFEEGVAQFQASYKDLLNYAWPRERYTAENAPGIKYL